MITCACLLGGSGSMSPQKNLNLDPLRLLLTQSGTRLLFNTCDKTYSISRFPGGGGGGGESSSPPCMKPCHACWDLTEMCSALRDIPYS